MTLSSDTIAVDSDTAPPADGCHAGEGVMRDAAQKAGKTAQLEQYDKDYPKGPHDQPQSMCPAFGSLRVGLRMRAPRRFCRALPVAFTDSRLLHIFMVQSAPSVTSRLILNRW